MLRGQRTFVAETADCFGSQSTPGDQSGSRFAETAFRDLTTEQ